MKLFNQLQTSEKIAIIGFLVGIVLFLYSFKTTLNGTHQHRQADSAFVGYFFCTENTDFLHPHIAPRRLTEGTAVNEFPVYGYVVGQICKVKGQWDEVTPKLISLLFAILAGLIFWQIIKLKYDLKVNSWIEFLALFIFVPVNWTFFTIPMPESTGLLLYATAGWIWTKFPLEKTNYLKNFKLAHFFSIEIEKLNSKNIFMNLLALVIFLFGFLVRPYYILLIFFFLPGLIQTVVILITSVFLFWFWYRYWNSMVTTVHGYFGIQFQTWLEIKTNLPNALAHLPVRVLEHTALIGLWSFFQGWKKYKNLIILYIMSVLMMYVLKSTHVAAHGYYLLNAGLFAVFIMYLHIQKETAKNKTIYLSLFLVYSLISTQHQFHINKNFVKTEAAVHNYGNLDEKAIVATYLGIDPQWLYYLKRTGFHFLPSEFNSVCPLGATHYMKWTEGHDSNVVLNDCPSLK